MSGFRLFAGLALAAVAWPLAANAVELPQRKNGLWQLTMGGQAGMPSATMKQCTDASTDKLLTMAASPVATDTCSQNDVSQTSTGYATDSVCTFGGKTSTTHSEFSGDFNSDYTVSVSSRIGVGAPASTMTISAKWMGDCTSDMKPGDVVLPGGNKINVIDLNAARAK